VKHKFLREKMFAFGDVWYGYGSCFCRVRDKLEQWDRYADSAKGVAISFDGTTLLQAGGPDKFAVVPMTYDKTIQSQHVEKVIDHAIQLSRILGIPKRDNIHFWFEVLFSLIPCALRSKHPSFAGEQEVRVLVTSVDREEAKVRKLRGTEIQYIERPVPLSVINEVMLGPRCPNSTEEVRDVLNRYGLSSVSVSRSTIPLR
jgi:hypothetical protein